MGLLYCMQQLLCHFEFLVLVLGHPCPLFDASLYYNQMTEEEWNRCPVYVHVPLTHFEVVIRRGMEQMPRLCTCTIDSLRSSYKLDPKKIGAQLLEDR